MQNASRSLPEQFWTSRSQASQPAVRIYYARSRRRCGSGSLGLLAIGFVSMAALAQGVPVINTPYVCANGLSYTIEICKPWGANNQMCQYAEYQNGQLVTEINSLWTQMTGRLAGCKVTPPKQTVPSPPSQSAAPVAANTQQTFNPAYLKEFPSPDQVIAQLKGANPQDTAYRQLTALHEFGQMVAAMAGTRLAQNQLTPDETRIITGYFNAYNTVAKTVASPQDAYAGKSDFTERLFTTFRMPTIQQIWETANRMTAGQQAGSNGQTPLPPTSDPTALAARRCIELGGTTGQCMTTGIGAGLTSLAGISPGALTNTSAAGPVMFGSYKAASGLTFTFSDGGVDISGCGKMVQGSHGVAMQPSGGTLALKISNQPQALQMILGADGKLVGPAAQDITGQKIIGYFVETNLKTGASTRNPSYGPDTEHCNVGTLLPGAATIPDEGMVADLGGALSMIGSVLGTSSPSDEPKVVKIAPGPRMVGTFASAGGLKIQFDDGYAVIDCAQAHVKVQYSVAYPAGSMRVTVQNGGSPLALTLGANGALSGSGTTTVNGKLMTALNANGDPILTPTSASCPVGTLTAAK